jgi:hypothetical protein
MAPQTGSFDPEKIKDKARKDILYLLEGVSKSPLQTLAKEHQLIDVLCRSEGRRIW